MGIAHLPGLAHTGLTELTARRDLSKLAVRAVWPGCGGREGDGLAAGRRGLGFAVMLADDEQARVGPRLSAQAKAPRSRLTMSRTSPPSRTRMSH